MTWRERRLVTILSTILVMLTLAVLIVLGIRYRESRAIEEGGQIDPSTGTVVDHTAYTKLFYETEAFTLSFTRDTLGKWHWDGNETFPLNDTTVTEILAQLTAWHPQQTLTAAEALASSGVDKPSRTLIATTENGATTTLVFGRPTTDGTSYYVQLNGDESTVYILADTIYKMMDTPIYDMCRLPQLPQLQEDMMQSIAVSRIAEEDGQLAPFTVLSAQRSEDGSFAGWRSNGANVTDDPSVKALVEDISALKITKCLLFDPSEEAVAICGFDEPAAGLTVTYTNNGTDSALNLTIGARLPDGSGRYVRLGEEPTIYFLPTELLDPLMRLATEGLAE